MELEYQTQAKIREMERETAHIRLLAASERENSRPRSSTPDHKRETPIMPLRVLRRACRQAGALRPAS